MGRNANSPLLDDQISNQRLLSPFVLLNAAASLLVVSTLRGFWVSFDGEALRWVVLAASLGIGAASGAMMGALMDRSRGPARDWLNLWSVPMFTWLYRRATVGSVLILPDDAVAIAACALLGPLFALPPMAILVALRRRSQRARAGSVLARWQQRRLLFVAFLYTAGSAGVVGAVWAHSRPIALSAVVLAASGAFILWYIDSGQLLRLRHHAKQAHSSVDAANAHELDLGVGDELWFCSPSESQSQSHPYRSHKQVTLVIRGALSLVLRQLERAHVMHGAFGLVVIAAAAFTTSYPTAPDLPGEPPPAGDAALIGSVCFLSSGTRWLSDIDGCPAVMTVRSDVLDVATRPFHVGFPGVYNRLEWFSIDYRGRFSVSTAGQYLFRLHADDGAIVFIDDKKLIDNDGVHPPKSESASTFLTAGDHQLRVRYLQGPRTEMALQLFVTPPGKPEQLWRASL
jgi:hypothetical protein